MPTGPAGGSLRRRAPLAVAGPSRTLLSFQRSLGQVPSQNRDQDEEAFIMAMIKSWEERKAEARAGGSGV